jgi:hypothetical protein
MSIDPDQTPRSDTDQGVTVGAADARADEERASGGKADVADESVMGGTVSDDREDFLDQGAATESTDQGVPVGSADVEADRERSRGDS